MKVAADHDFLNNLIIMTGINSQVVDLNTKETLSEESNRGCLTTYVYRRANTIGR